jgi:flagellar protein FlgJ
VTAAITDFTQYSSLRASAQQNPQDADLLREVAGQFEALFVQTLLKNMRDTSLGEPIFGNSSQHEMYVEMLDKQLAVEMSRGQGFGIADVLARQLGGVEADAGAKHAAKPDTFSLDARTVASMTRPATAAAANEPSEIVSGTEIADTRAPVVRKEDLRWDTPGDFVRDIWPLAERAAARLGVEPRAVVAQAALETGWGAHVMRKADGSNSFNLFGIKAGGSWSGDSVARATLEFRNGLPQQEQARFRAYSNLDAAFADYADFLTSRPRYAPVLDSAGDGRRFAAALQEAGYATDPLYAAKIARIMQSDTMRASLTELKLERAAPITTVAATLVAR